MKKLVFLLVLSGCDTIQVRPNIGQCIKHSWARKGIFEIVKKEPGITMLRNTIGSGEIKINDFEKGWSTVDCQNK